MTHKIREVYIVHHSHTDVGYTDLQEQVIYNQANNIRRAVELIENGTFLPIWLPGLPRCRHR